MSNDSLLLSIDQNAQALEPLRQHPPLFAAIVCPEDEGTNLFESLHLALPEFVRASAGRVEVVHSIPFSTGAGGHTYGLSVFAEGTVPEAQRAAAYSAFVPVARRASGLIQDLPDRTRERLGIRESFGTPVHDWVWVLFHLAEHFPDHFARGAVRRYRLLQTEHGPLVAPEEWLQLGGVTGPAQDRYPGLIFSRFPRELDLVNATGHALDLLRRAVRGGGAFRVTDANRDQLRNLHQEFVTVGERAARSPSPNGADPDARVLRLDNSFRTPPAAEWAGYQPGGAVQQTLLLSHLRAVREVCVLRGSWVTDFTGRADRAGAILPAWSDQRGAALLADASTRFGDRARPARPGPATGHLHLATRRVARRVLPARNQH